MRVDFSKIEIVGIDGRPVTVDMSRKLGNALYYGSKDYALSNLGARIYTEKEIEVCPEEAEVIMRVAHELCPWVVSKAIDGLFGAME